MNHILKLTIILPITKSDAENDILAPHITLNQHDELKGIINTGHAFGDYDELHFTDGAIYESEIELWSLPIEELHAGLLLICQKMDTNKDKKISLSELIQWSFYSLHRLDTAENAEKDFQNADENRNGQLSFDEFVKYSFADDEYSRLQRAKDHHRIYARWLSATKDYNDFLEIDSFKKFKNPFQDFHQARLFRLLALQYIDANKDEVIDREEFMSDWWFNENLVNLETISGETLASFRDDQSWSFAILDHDDDGVLKGVEIYYWMSPDMVIEAYEEAETLFNTCRVPITHQLTYDDVIKNMEAFKNAKTIERGKQIHRLLSDL